MLSSLAEDAETLEKLFTHRRRPFLLSVPAGNEAKIVVSTLK